MVQTTDENDCSVFEMWAEKILPWLFILLFIFGILAFMGTIK